MLHCTHLCLKLGQPCLPSSNLALQLLSALPLLQPLTNIQPQPIRIQIHLIRPTLQNTRDILRVLKLAQIDVGAGLLDGVANELGGARFTLRPHDAGLLFLARFVDDEGGALGFLLRYLFRFNCCCEFGGEGEVLDVRLVRGDGLGVRR